MTETTAAPEPLYLQQANPYAHPMNLQFGQARIMAGSQQWKGPTGWFLPFNRFTTNKFEAMDAAIAIDKLIRESERPALAA
jgi:hypothetical protein